MLRSYSKITLIFIKYIDYSFPLDLTSFHLTSLDLTSLDLTSLDLTSLDLACWMLLDPLDGAPPLRRSCDLLRPPLGQRLSTAATGVNSFLINYYCRDLR